MFFAPRAAAVPALFLLLGTAVTSLPATAQSAAQPGGGTAVSGNAGAPENAFCIVNASDKAHFFAVETREGKRRFSALARAGFHGEEMRLFAGVLDAEEIGGGGFHHGVVAAFCALGQGGGREQHGGQGRGQDMALTVCVRMAGKGHLSLLRKSRQAGGPARAMVFQVHDFTQDDPCPVTPEHDPITGLSSAFDPGGWGFLLSQVHQF